MSQCNVVVTGDVSLLLRVELHPTLAQATGCDQSLRTSIIIGGSAKSKLNPYSFEDILYSLVLVLPAMGEFVDQPGHVMQLSGFQSRRLSLQVAGKAGMIVKGDGISLGRLLASKPRADSPDPIRPTNRFMDPNAIDLQAAGEYKAGFFHFSRGERSTHYFFLSNFSIFLQIFLIVKRWSLKRRLCLEDSGYFCSQTGDPSSTPSR